MDILPQSIHIVPTSDIRHPTFSFYLIYISLRFIVFFFSAGFWIYPAIFTTIFFFSFITTYKYRLMDCTVGGCARAVGNRVTCFTSAYVLLFKILF